MAKGRSHLNGRYALCARLYKTPIRNLAVTIVQFCRKGNPYNYGGVALEQHTSGMLTHGRTRLMVRASKQV